MGTAGNHSAQCVLLLPECRHGLHIFGRPGIENTSNMEKQAGQIARRGTKACVCCVRNFGLTRSTFFFAAKHRSAMPARAGYLCYKNHRALLNGCSWVNSESHALQRFLKSEAKQFLG